MPRNWNWTARNWDFLPPHHSPTVVGRGGAGPHAHDRAWKPEAVERLQALLCCRADPGDPGDLAAAGGGGGDAPDTAGAAACQS